MKILTTREKAELMLWFDESEDNKVEFYELGGWHKLKMPTWSWYRYSYRKEVKQKKINLSPFINSGIDMEFSNSNETVWVIDKVVGAIPTTFVSDKGEFWAYCRPRMNHPHAWNGGERHIPGGFTGTALLRSGMNILLSNINKWSHDSLNTELDVIQFTITGIEEGYTL